MTCGNKEEEEKSVAMIGTFPLLHKKKCLAPALTAALTHPVSPEEKWQRLFSDTKWRRVMNVPDVERGPKGWGDFFSFFQELINYLEHSVKTLETS